jgi:hypothetical protein
MSGTQIAVVPTSNREKADALLARITPQKSKALLQTADLATKVTAAMAPAMRHFAEKAGNGARALSTVEVEHRDADGSITVVKARVDLVGGK